MNKRVLITGGTGNLGRKVRRRLVEQGYAVRIMSRREPQPGEDDSVEWAVAQLTSGEGVREAVRGADVIVHTASSPFPASVELDGGRHLLAAAQAEGIEHFVYISIIGVDRIAFSYYEHKHQVEQMVAGSGVPYTILRAAQFHAFVDMIIGGLAKLPVLLQPQGWQFQPVSAEDVAAGLVRTVADGPQGRLPDLAGPELLTLDEMVQAWLDAQDMRKPVIRVPVPGGLSRGFRAGHNTAPDRATDGMTWGDYLAGKGGDRAARAQREAQTA
jgi:uncharacterized protein YbjT (DUF2867 family)